MFNGYVKLPEGSVGVLLYTSQDLVEYHNPSWEFFLAKPF